MNKLRALLLFFCVLYIGILIKLFYIQVIAQDKFYTNNYLRTERIEPARGQIFDRNMQPLVLNETTYQLTAEPKKVEEKDESLRKIFEILKTDSDEQSTMSSRMHSDKSWVPLKQTISQNEKDALSKLELKGVGFTQQSQRYYPEGSSAAQLLGFVGKTQDGDDIGYFGLEGFYDKDLAGLPGLFNTERDILGKPIFIGTQQMVKGEDGRNLVLTIDKNVQRIAKSKLQEGMEKFEAKEGCVVVAQPMTGEIFALTCLPDFDPDNFKDFSEDYFKDPAITSLYEPGSIIKPLVVAAAVNEGAVKPDDIYDEEGPVRIGEYTINTWDNKYEGKITITRILEKSSNVGMVYIGQKLGNEKLLYYFEKYGFSDRTGIDLQGEGRGVLKKKSQLYPIDYATLTFGQGIVVTPIRMIIAFSTVINGGYVMKPYVVKEMVSSNGEKSIIEPKKVAQVLSKKTSLTMREMLVNTVEQAEARWKRPKGYKIGGKTGTAQIPIAGKYDPSKTIASFIGFAPADNPKLIVLVVYKEPATSPWGSETAAPVFFEIIKDLLVYYNIPPE